MYQYLRTMEIGHIDIALKPDTDEADQQLPNIAGLHPGHDYIISLGGI